MDTTRQTASFTRSITHHNGEMDDVTDVTGTGLLSAYGATFTDWLPVCIKTANTYSQMLPLAKLDTNGQPQICKIHSVGQWLLHSAYRKFYFLSISLEIHN
jgi:hypothetical protein